jgi:serine/threonine protein kinase
MFKIGNGPAPTLKDPSKYSEDFVNFVTLCLNKEPTERPTANALLQHPFLAKAKPPAVTLQNVLEQYYEFQLEEQAGNKV